LIARSKPSRPLSTPWSRIRTASANLSALKGSAEERTLVKRYTKELNQQEDKLATLRKDLDTLNQQHQTATEDLSNKIESLNVDEKVG
jgi:hypothetical protein